MKVSHCLLIKSLSEPSSILSLSLKDWDLLIRQARSARLLASLYFLCVDENILEGIPQRALNHLDSASKQAEKTVISAMWELSLISKIANRLECPVIILKGAAYAKLSYSNSRGRIFSDVDLLVPEEQIYDAEVAFVKAGWESSKTDEYDQQYYRKWMHELPPMRNTRTGVSLDLHHSILPKTASIKVEAKKLIANAKLLDGEENLYVFSKEDMLLHSIVHLFNEGEFEHGLRDLVDQDYMLRTFSLNDAKFYDELADRANALGLGLPLFYAVRYCQIMLNRTFPKSFIGAISQFAPRNIWFMDKLFLRALMPDHKSCDDWFTSAARWLLFVRSHYLRMPPHLLIPHLLRKAYKSRMKDKEVKAEAV